jgi:hypothetical protein
MTFEQWWGTCLDWERIGDIKEQSRDAWDAAQKAQREKDARIADQHQTEKSGEYWTGYDMACAEIDLAIREQGAGT